MRFQPNVFSSAVIGIVVVCVPFYALFFWPLVRGLLSLGGV